MSKKKILTEYKCVDEDQIMHDKEANVFARDKMRFFSHQFYILFIKQLGTGR